MDYALESEDGKRVRLDASRPLLLKVRRGDQPGGEIAVGLKDGQPFLDNRSSAQCQVNDVDRAACLLADGDHLQLGALRFTVVALSASIDVEEPAAKPPVPASTQSDSDRHRQQRRISASRMTSVEPRTQSSGLLQRVSAAFSGRAEKQRLDELEAERRVALVEAGRRSLSDGSALGLPAEAMSRLQRGQAASLRPEELDGFARWRSERQRMVRLDAEIAALRQALGLGPDPEAVVLTAVHLGSDEKAKLERAHATMDAVSTQPINEPAPPVRSAQTSARRPARRH